MKFNLNMVLAALLGTVFVLMTVSFVSEAIFDPRLPEKEGYVIAVPESDASGAPVKVEETPISVLLASADAGAGERVFKRCQACHTDTEGGPNKVGPNLWDLVNRPIASHEGFSYSAAMKDFSDGGEKHWTYENLDVFIKAPKKDVPGTAMGFAGLSDDQDRADLIAYLSTMSNNPVPFPNRRRRMKRLRRRATVPVMLRRLRQAVKMLPLLQPTALPAMLAQGLQTRGARRLRQPLAPRRRRLAQPTASSRKKRIIGHDRRGIGPAFLSLAQ
nr:cytochrome c family protein [Marinicella sp. W31]MDC2878678.1 cytochrome c family protein [Marinicella sp. W31]